MATKEKMDEIRARHERFSGPLDDLCAFHIGQQVALRDVSDSMVAELEMNGPTVVKKERSRLDYGAERALIIPPMTVVSRWVEQCYGGIQVHYSLRSVVMSGSNDMRMSEYELMDWNEATETRKQHVVDVSDKGES